jgi:superfamily II DNA or RNA helicase/HKD family nuclease
MTDSPISLPPGLYELPVDARLDEVLSALSSHLADRKPLDPADSHAVLATYLEGRIAAALRGARSQEEQVELANRILRLLAQAGGEGGPLVGTSLLREIRPHLAPPLPRPDTPLAQSWLLARTRLDPTLLSQLKKEIQSAGQIDIICSFIKWSGLRCVLEELEAFAHTPGRRLRVLTTSYMGATDLKAVECLRELPNTEVRVSYDRDRTRLHAKAFLFHRTTGFGTAYIGSANLSSAALTEGLEWNVKISQYESSHLWQKLTAAFETHWLDGEFSPYRGEDKEKLAEALREASGAYEVDRSLLYFDLKPYPFQQEILDRIAYERYAGRQRHLIVAATGTGKTLVSAFDYRTFAQAEGGRYPRLLFIAHREEILTQSLATFRAVLRDLNFGECYVGAHRSERFDHLFMSIQSFHAGEFWKSLPPEHFAYIVVDEFHHAEAPTYSRLLEHFTPRTLLGLTATPERADGRDVLRHFDGHLTAEIRLPDAINRKLLCPFQYFGVTDSEDLSQVRWQRGGYLPAELDRLYTGNDRRAALTIQKVREILLDPRLARGLGFCVSVAHAQFMARKFTAAGLPAVALTGESDTRTRNAVQGQLTRREINFIFTVDLYNEGVDLPEVDTVLFLRPTESLTVFLQQLGRGLRQSPGKECLTVLDFIGQAHRKFRFDLRYRALLDDPTRPLGRQVEQDFPHLPSGCLVKLERIAKERVLNNIRQSLRGTRTRLVEELREDADRLGAVPSFGAFLERHRLVPDDIYRKEISWSRLCVEAGLGPSFADPDEARLTKGLRRLQHIGGPRQIQALLELLTARTLPTPDALTEETRRWLAMLHFSLWGKDAVPDESRDAVLPLRRLRRNPTLAGELGELLRYRQGQLAVPPHTLDLPFPCPLELHAAYTRDELLLALGHWTLEEQKRMTEGVRYLPALPADLFLITLHKTEADYSPSTMYEDYAMGDTRFHWQSQSTTSESSATGRRYQEHARGGHTILLCVREHKTVDGLSAPYCFLGPADYVAHTGSKPMSIIWELHHPLPASLLRWTARAAVG